MADSKTMVVKLLEGVRTVEDFESMREGLRQENLSVLNDFLYEKIKDSTGKLYHNIKQRTYNDRSYYEGEYNSSTGKREGYGFYQYPGGDKYFGSWSNDKFNGGGCYIYTNGERFQGEYQEGLREGFGKFWAFNGGLYNGNFHQDKRHGSGIYW